VGSMSTDDWDRVVAAIAAKTGVNANDDISIQEVGASWGSQVRDRAITGLIVFLVLVVLFIWAYFREWKMSVGAMVALAHDLIITVGVYALSGFEVTPATVTGVLTILGFSLYDTVVVFDKVRENTKNMQQSRKTYAELANLAVNQTLVRSINTSIVALLPVGALLYVGIFQLGSGALKDLALALFVGMAAGAYSSIFIATPLVAQLKSREKAISEQDRRAQARAKRDADRYANVPVFTDDMPIADEPEAGLGPDDHDGSAPRAPFRAPSAGNQATGSGRVVPSRKAPVQESGSAKRSQPSRQPRSKRGK
jgi:preprotein translocase subunit SecF